MVRQMSNQYQELHGLKVSGCHIFANMDTFKTIVEFYGSPRGPVKTGNPLWERLAGIENRIVMGEVDSVGGVHYLPLHWVSVVFDVQQGCIVYGDSLGRAIPKLEQKAFTRWIMRLSQRSSRNISAESILVHQLPTGYQNDSTSCGLFALNAVGHHYLDHQILPTNRASVVGTRMDIVLDLLNGNMVCVISYIPSHPWFDGYCRVLKLRMIPLWLISPSSFLHHLSNFLSLHNYPHQNTPLTCLPSSSWMIILLLIPSKTPPLRLTLNQWPCQKAPWPKTLVPHPHFSASGDSDSEMFYPPSSGGPSDASSAAVSESDLPSAVTSEADLPPKSHLHPTRPKKQTGIHDFFRALSENEVEAARAKRKRGG